MSIVITTVMLGGGARWMALAAQRTFLAVGPEASLGS